jgi:OPA family glycerol-3-phosphate transporter-like MFS transporter
LSRTFWNLWSSYASYYFGRADLSIIMPILLATYSDLSLYNVGAVASGFLIAYAAGQFIHGQISEKFNPFVYISIGLIGSGIINLFLGAFGAFFWCLMIGKVFDGGFQSMGWSSIVRANSETSPDPEKSSVILGTAYQFGNSLAWLVCALVVGTFGWHTGFYVSGAIMVIRGVLLYFSRKDVEIVQKRTIERIKIVLSKPIVMASLAYGCLNMVRWGIITWMPTYLFKTFNMPIDKVGFTIFLIPIAGIIGTLILSRINKHKEMVSIAYLGALAISISFVPETTGIVTAITLFATGLFMYAPHTFLVSTVPSRYLEKKTVAGATGFIDGIGYIGASLIGVIVPFIVDKTGEWKNVFYFLSVITIVVIILIAVLYSNMRRNDAKATA